MVTWYSEPLGCQLVHPRCGLRPRARRRSVPSAPSAWQRRALIEHVGMEQRQMEEQCELWAKWLGAAPAAPGKPCYFVSTLQPPASIFRLPPNAVQDNILFQPLPKVEKNWQRFQKDSFMPGGTGPIRIPPSESISACSEPRG